MRYTPGTELNFSSSAVVRRVGFRVSLGRDVCPVERQSLGETRVGHDIANVILSNEGDIRKSELLVEEQRRRVVRPIERSDRIDPADVVEQRTIVPIHCDLGTYWEMSAGPVCECE